MGIILHPLARTTPSTRAELQAEGAHLTDAELARRYGTTPPTVHKWRAREDTADRSHRPHTLHCRMTPAQEVVAMAVREILWLTLDDLLVVVREFLNPKVSRSGLMRWGNATVRLTEGMGHFGVARHPDIIQQAIAFLR